MASFLKGSMVGWFIDFEGSMVGWFIGLEGSILVGSLVLTDL